MKFKYFLRGIGIGMIITAILLGISYQSKMSDEAIISKAKKLGMVFAETPNETAMPVVTDNPTVTKMPEVSEEPKETKFPDATGKPEEAKSPDATVKPEETKSPDATGKPEEIKSPDATGKPEETKSPDATGKPKESINNGAVEKKTLDIYSGDSSRIVAERLEKLGVIDDYVKFDEFLIKNGYANKLVVGKYSLSGNLSYKMIAEAITE